jgi:hypothetical protein
MPSDTLGWALLTMRVTRQLYELVGQAGVRLVFRRRLVRSRPGHAGALL